jgi:hypothetical protein
LHAGVPPLPQQGGENRKIWQGEHHSGKPSLVKRGTLVIRAVFKAALLFALLTPIASHASYISNYAEWKKLPPLMQEAYLIGVMDGWTRTFDRGEPAWMQLERTGVNKCLREQEMTSKVLVTLVNTHYETYTADWRVPPASIVKHVVMGPCLADVNGEREKAGLAPWERQPSQYSRE